MQEKKEGTWGKNSGKNVWKHNEKARYIFLVLLWTEKNTHFKNINFHHKSLIFSPLSFYVAQEKMGLTLNNKIDEILPESLRNQDKYLLVYFLFDSNGWFSKYSYPSWSYWKQHVLLDMKHSSIYGLFDFPLILPKVGKYCDCIIPFR